MSNTHRQTFADSDLSEMMAAANKARSEALGEMLRQASAFIAGFFTSRSAVATQV